MSIQVLLCDRYLILVRGAQLNINATLISLTILLLTIVIVGLTVKFAKGKTTHLLQVGMLALLLNLVFAPAGWIYCWYWSTKAPLTR